MQKESRFVIMRSSDISQQSPQKGRNMRRKEAGRTGTFGAKLYSMFMGSMVIPVLISMLCFWMYSNHILLQREEQNIQNVLHSVSQNLEMQFSESRDIANTFYIYNQVFQEAESLNNPGLYQYHDVMSRVQMESTYVMTMTKLLHTSKQNVRDVVFFPAAEGDRAYYLGVDRGQLKEIIYPEYHREKWFQEALESGNSVIFQEMHVPEYAEGKKPMEVYSYISSVRDMNAKRVIGVVKIDVGSDMLEDTLNITGTGREKGLVLLQGGEYFASSSCFTKENDMEVLSGGRMRVEDTVYQIQSTEIADTDLELIYLDSRSSLYRGYFYMISLSLLILLTGGVLAFVNYRRQARKMVADVQRITGALQQVEKGNLDISIQLKEESEFRKIAEAINRMADHLKRYIEKEYLMELQQQKAEYRALQSQINPHFLYNTLNGFVALNRMGEKKVLESSIVGLSRLFRYACSRQDSATVQEETKFLEDYLKLEKLKHQERLDYMIWTDEESRKKVIPKLLLQPIVENSIKHGMGDEERHIMISVLAKAARVKGIGDVVILSVRDNGVGFEEAKKEQDRGVGIENVRERVQLFDKKAIFQCISVPGKGTKTTIVFPEEREGDLNDHTDRG